MKDDSKNAGAAAGRNGIRNVILIIMDSLNRHFLPAYGNDWVRTPNIDRLARRSVVFDSHYICSTPCMPARHDFMTANSEFLWRPWGPIEHNEDTVIKRLRGKVTTQLITDHYHYFERGGETYHADFDGWEPVRGHENDAWITKPNEVDAARCSDRYRRNMGRLREERDFPSAKTFQAACDWLDENHGLQARFLLWVEEFDPHEPFHTCEPYNSMYDPDWKGPFHFWPEYGQTKYTEREARHLRAQYAGKVTMADAWLGRLLDKLDKRGLWKDSLVIFTTDHGHFLGEHGWWGKGVAPQFDTIARIPLMVAYPGMDGGRRSTSLTAGVDIGATLYDAFGEDPGKADGRSILPLVRGEKDRIRERVLYGAFGSHVQVTDGRMTYLRRPVEGNLPLSIYRNTWTFAPWVEGPIPFERVRMVDTGPRWSPHTGRWDLEPEDKKLFWNLGIPFRYPNLLFDLKEDPAQERNLSEDKKMHAKAEEMLVETMQWEGAPPEQFMRMGLE